jgi:hypothetical protein
VAAPGHTPGHIALVDERDGTLIAGDAFSTLGGVSSGGRTNPRFPLVGMATWDRATANATGARLAALAPSAPAAARLADRDGYEVLTLGAGERIRDAAVGRAGEEALLALAEAHRGYAREHPGVYTALQRAPEPGDDELAATGARLLEPVFAVLAGFGLAGDAAVHAARALRSAMHGFVDLERVGGFGIDLDADASYRAVAAGSALERGRRRPYAGLVAPQLQLSVAPSPHTAAAVRLLRAARHRIPCAGSLCAALDLADPAGAVGPDAYAESVAALDVGARVFGYDAATEVGAHSHDAVLVADIAVYNLTGAAADIPAALNAFRRAAGPLLEPTRR